MRIIHGRRTTRSIFILLTKAAAAACSACRKHKKWSEKRAVPHRGSVCIIDRRRSSKVCLAKYFEWRRRASEVALKLARVKKTVEFQYLTKSRIQIQYWKRHRRQGIYMLSDVLKFILRQGRINIKYLLQEY